MRLKNVNDVASWRLCLGCGACVYGCPEKKVRLTDVPDEGLRPVIDGTCAQCQECLDFCPGWSMGRDTGALPGEIKELEQCWGPVLELWEGYAVDTEVRYQSSSGGVATALALYCLENEGMEGVLHTGADPREAWKNMPVVSRDRAGLLKNTGSRYSPSSPCSDLGRVEEASSPCVFIGKPCDAAAARKAAALKPGLKKNLGLVIGIFCAGTPASKGTLELLANFKVDPERTDEVRYRGRGWPGCFTARERGQPGPSVSVSYSGAWGFLQKFRPLRCHLCPDGTAEEADVSCGDPWFREISPGEHGTSLVVVRTEPGRKIVRKALDAGYIALRRAEPWVLEASQKNLLEKRKGIWGRLLAFRLLLLPAPRLTGYSLFKCWTGLDMREKARSFLGTARRILARGYFLRLKY